MTGLGEPDDAAPPALVVRLVVTETWLRDHLDALTTAAESAMSHAFALNGLAHAVARGDPVPGVSDSQSPALSAAALTATSLRYVASAERWMARADELEEAWLEATLPGDDENGETR